MKEKCGSKVPSACTIDQCLSNGYDGFVHESEPWAIINVRNGNTYRGFTIPVDAILAFSLREQALCMFQKAAVVQPIQIFAQWYPL